VTELPAKDRCLVMGVVNVTPDSFSDGGQWYGADAAIAHGLDLAAQGADIVDVGGESTRPGAQRIDEAEELRRIGPVVTELVRAGLTVSIDTMRARVAEFAHAWIKERCGLRQFRCRGRLKATMEATWACLTYNLMRWFSLRRALQAQPAAIG